MSENALIDQAARLAALTTVTLAFMVDSLLERPDPLADLDRLRKSVLDGNQKPADVEDLAAKLIREHQERMFARLEAAILPPHQG